MSMQEREWSCLQKVERTGRAGVLTEFSPLHALNKIPAERALALCTGSDDRRDLPLADFGRCGVADFALNRERRAGLMSSMPGRVHAGVSVVGQQESDDDLLRAEDWSPEQLTHGNGLVWLGVMAFVVLLGFLTGRPARERT